MSVVNAETEPGSGTLRWSAGLMVAVTLLAFGLRAYHLDFQSLWRDEVDALVFASRDLQAVLGNFTKTGENGPLYFLLLRFWIAGTGTTEFSARFFSLFFGVLTIPLAYAMGRRFLKGEIGLLAGLVAAVSPYYIWYSQEAKMYSLLTFLTLASVYLYLLALRRNLRWIWLSYVLITSVSVYVHFFSPLIILFEVAVFLAGLRQYVHAVRGWALCVGLLTLPYVPLALWQLPTLAQPPPTSYPFVDLGTMLSILTLAFSLNASPVPVFLLLGFYVFLCLAGLALYKQPNRTTVNTGNDVAKTAPSAFRGFTEGRTGTALLVGYFLVPALAFYVVSLRMPLFTDRYLIIISPAYYLLLACGLAVVRQRSYVLLGTSLLAVLFASGYSFWMQTHTTIKPDFRSAAAYVSENSHGPEPVMFVMPYAAYTFAYYHGDVLQAVEPPFTNSGMGEEQVDAGLQRQLTGMDRLWLLLSEPALYDARGLVKRWLDSNATLLESKSFTGVELRRYALSPPRPLGSGSPTASLPPATRVP